MRVLLFVILLASIFSSSHAQKKAKVILKNGDKYKGYVEEYVRNDHIVINSDYFGKSYIGYDSIFFIKGKNMKYSDRLPDDRKGWYGQVESGFIIAKEQQGDPITFIPFIHLLAGHTFKTVYRPGLGIGLDRFTGVTFMPIYASFDYDLGRKRKALYLNARAGYSAIWENDGSFYEDYVKLQGGLYWSFAIGYRVQYFRSRFYINIRYINQSANLSVEDFGFEATEKRKYRNLAIGLAYLFGQ